MRAEFAPKHDVEIVPGRWADRRFNGNVFETQMDPGSQALRFPTKATPVWARRNPVYDVQYEGGDNLSDNTVAVATLNRASSQYKLYDLGHLPILVNYLGLGLNPNSKNLRYNQQFVNDELEALAAAYATQLTEIPFLQQTITTDIPKMLSGDAAKIGYSVWYQQVVQSFMAVFAKYNSTMSLVDAMVEMGYNGEAPRITEITNLMKKMNLYSLLQQIGIVVSQEYADIDWFKETTVINGLPSRVANDAQSPLLTITGAPYIPHVEVKSGNTVLFSTITPNSPGYNDFNNIQVQVNGITYVYTLQSLTAHILESMDPFQIVGFAREIFNGLTTDTVENYINDLIKCLQALLDTASAFKSYTTDFDTFLMVVQNNTGLNHWVVNAPFTAPSRPRVQVQPSCVCIIDDIFKAFGTSGNLQYDGVTRRWSIFTPWRGDSGIVKYDSKDGGFFISTSVRDIPANVAGYDGIEYLFPKMFERYFDTSNIYYQVFVSRDGHSFMMDTITMNAAAIAADPFFAYLNANADSTMSIEVPRVQLPSITTDYVRMSTINKVLVSLFGTGIAIYGSGGSQITNKAVNTDLLMYVGRQFGNFAEDAINYLQARAPLRLKDGDVNLGFKFSAPSAEGRSD